MDKSKLPKIPARAQSILGPLSEKAREAGIPLFLVGGCVRDWLSGKSEAKDLDLCVVGDPVPLAEFCARSLGAKSEAFGRFGTLRVTASSGVRVDFARARTEKYPSPAVLPEVSPAVRIEEDLIRRDFTVNAMALRLFPEPRKLVDPMGGLADLRGKTIRLLHDESFRDDPTRVFRAARYLARFGFKPSAELESSARAALSAGYVDLLSRHRVLQELLRILEEKNPLPALEFLRRWGYLKIIHPGFKFPKELPLFGAMERLALLALGLGPEEGLKFIRSFPLEHETSSLICDALARAKEKSVGRAALSAFACRVLKTAYPRLNRSGLKPLFLSGDDVRAKGVSPGARMGKILDHAAHLQWQGKITSRREALAWLAGPGLKER